MDCADASPKTIRVRADRQAFESSAVHHWVPPGNSWSNWSCYPTPKCLHHRRFCHVKSLWMEKTQNGMKSSWWCALYNHTIKSGIMEIPCPDKRRTAKAVQWWMWTCGTGLWHYSLALPQRHCSTTLSSITLRWEFCKIPIWCIQIISAYNQAFTYDITTTRKSKKLKTHRNHHYFQTLYTLCSLVSLLKNCFRESSPQGPK